MRVPLATLAGIAVLTSAVAAACGGNGGGDATPAPTPAASPTPSPTAATMSTDAATATPEGERVAVFITGDGRQVSLSVEVADSPEERQQGLMFREELPEDAGMIFLYEEETAAGFWMRDTLIPLSIAFVSGEGIIIDIQDMEPLSEELHHSPAPFIAAVEANQGWFERNGIAPGDRVLLQTAVP